jgi:hypothetical protein
MRNSIPCLVAFCAVACFGDSQIGLTPSNVIGSSGYYTLGGFGTAFAPGGIFGNQTGEVSEPTQSGYWLNPDNGPANAYILIDLGAQYNLTDLELYNTHNSQFYDRGTGDFSFEASNSISGGALVDPVTILTNTLNAIAFGTPDPIAGQTFSVTGTYEYLEFLPTTVAAGTNGGSGCCGANNYGLDQLKVFGTAASSPTVTPEPSSIGLLTLGLSGVLWLHRRRLS